MFGVHYVFVSITLDRVHRALVFLVIFFHGISGRRPGKSEACFSRLVCHMWAPLQSLFLIDGLYS